jgi:hypothetical protein
MDRNKGNTMWFCFIFLTPHSGWICRLRLWWGGPGLWFCGRLCWAATERTEGPSHRPQGLRSGASSSGSIALLPSAGVRPASSERRWRDGPQLLALRGTADPWKLSASNSSKASYVSRLGCAHTARARAGGAGGCGKSAVQTMRSIVVCSPASIDTPTAGIWGERWL